jgi:signal transduction histidine kinase
MRLFQKVAALLVGAAALPLGTAGFALVALNQRALESEVRARFDQTAQHAAEVVAGDIEGRARQLPRLAALIGWSALGPAELTGALALFQRQAGAAAATSFDARGARTPVDEAFAARIPLERARAEGTGAVVFSAPFPHPTVGTAVAAALAVDSASGAIALLLPLDGQYRRLAEVRGAEAAHLFLVDERGNPIANGQARPGGAAPRSVVDDAVARKDGHARRFLDGARPVIAAFAPVGGLGWTVIVEEDATSAFAAALAMRRVTVAGAGAAALVALALAFLFARRLTGRLERLAGAADALGRGQLETRVEPGPPDEIGFLSARFNQMGAALATSRGEIEGWNRELEARVEARTRELQEAQAQLVQAQKLAALGQLGAGVAHEINNPLGGVIGHVQLLLADKRPTDGDFEALRCIEEGARKASSVVQNLLRFSVQRQEPVHTNVDTARLVRDTLSLTETLLADAQIRLELELEGPGAKIRGDAGQLGQVLLNLVSNARTAMKERGGTLRVSTRRVGAEVALEVADSGKGIAPEVRHRIFEPFFTTKDEWSNVGLGLSVSFRIVEEHGGRIEVASELGRGSTFTVYLPAA